MDVVRGMLQVLGPGAHPSFTGLVRIVRVGSVPKLVVSSVKCSGRVLTQILYVYCKVFGLTKSTRCGCCQGVCLKC